MNQEAYEEAKKCAHRILRARDKTSYELRKRLQEKGHGAEVADKVVERFVEVGLVDDERYLEFYLLSARASHKGWQRVLRELEQKGIDTEGLAPPEPEEELDNALAVIERLPITTYKEREKALRRLVNKGYNYGIAKRAVDSRWNEEEIGEDGGA